MRHRRASFAVLVAVLFLVLTLLGCGRADPWRREAYVFGTRVELLLPRSEGLDESSASAAMAEVLQEFERLHRAYHTWQPSELSRLNAAISTGQSATVSAELAALVSNAQAVAAASAHLFDPGVGKLIALWGFHSDELPSRLPDPAQVGALVATRPSISALKIEGSDISSTNRSVALDFGGYLKGVALDRAASQLRARGIRHALINIGGNVMALGNRDGNTDGEAWRVGIQHPRAERHGGLPLASLELRDGEALGTSGDYHRFFAVDGKRYCHLIDPRTGRPADHTQSVTILIPPGANAGMQSDALSKPIFIAGEQWQAMAAQLKVAHVLRVGADDTLIATTAMKARLKLETGITIR